MHMTYQVAYSLGVDAANRQMRKPAAPSGMNRTRSLPPPPSTGTFRFVPRCRASVRTFTAVRLAVPDRRARCKACVGPEPIT